MADVCWRVAYRLLREHFERRQALDRATAIHIQAKLRTFWTRRVYRIMRRKYDARMRIALFCQCACRLRKSQIVVYVAAAEGRHRKEVNAVCCIQRMYRCRAARDEYAKRKQAYMEYLAARLDATITIQAHSRTWAALVIFRQLKAEKDEYDARMAEVTRWASSTIQALYRGHCGRIRAVLRDESAQGGRRCSTKTREDPSLQPDHEEIRWRRPPSLELMLPLRGNAST